jgi:uncharacterized protein (TIGR02099 family)
MKHDSNPPPPRTLKALSWTARALWWVVLAGWGLFALSWGALHGWIVPRIGEWRPQLETAASQALGTPVRVGAIRATSTGAIPAIELVDVRLFDREGREALHLPLVQSALSVRSLWRLGFEQLVIDSPSLDVRRTRDGQWRVAGLDIASANAQDQSTLADWFFSQTEFVIRRGQIRWQDERLDQAPLELSNVDLVLRNPGRCHLVRLDATPPAEWGERFSLRGDFSQPFSLTQSRHWEHWSGTAYADFERVDLQRLRAQFVLSDLPLLQVHQGNGALRLWADMQRGQLSALTADTALAGVRLQLGPQLPALDLPGLSGRVSAIWRPQQWEVGTRDLQLQTANGSAWPVGSVRLTHQLTGRGRPPESEFSADRMELAALHEVAQHLPLPQAWRTELASARPAGLLNGLRLRWLGPLQSDAVPTEWQAQGHIAQLSVAPGRLAFDASTDLARPGIDGGTLDFDVGPAGGRLQLALNQGALTWPGLFDQARVDVARLQGEMNWRLDGDKLDIRIPQLGFSNADAEGEMSLHWHTGRGTARQPRLPGVLDLTAQLSRANGAQVHRYLPRAIAADARRYVREAVTRGEARDVRFRVKGDLERFPFARAADGEFRISAQMTGVDFDYVPPFVAAAGDVPWPGLRDLQGRFQMDRQSLRLSEVKGGFAGLPSLRLAGFQAELDDYTRLGAVGVTGQVAGAASDMLAYVNRSPVSGFIGQALAQARFGGNADLALKLRLPLDALATSTVQGTLNLPANDLQFTPDTPQLTRTVGQLQFTEKGFTVPQAVARVYGGELRFDGGMRPGPQGRNDIAFQGQGVASVDGLRQARELTELAPWLAAASGSTPYQVQLAFRQGRPDLTVNSSLQGLALALPAPLDKPAASALPLRLHNGPTDANGGTAQDRLALDLGAPASPLLALRFERDVSGPSARVLRGAIQIGATGPPSLPTSGVVAQLSLPALDVDAWDTWLVRSGQAATVGTPATQSYLPSQIGVAVDRLTVAQRVLHKLRVQARRDDNVWRTQVAADELTGRIDYRAAQGQAAGQVFARLSHLKLERSAAGNVDQLLRQQPTSVPALDVVVDRLELGQRELGRLALEAVNRSTDSGNEWRLNRIELAVPEARLTGSGNWATVGAAVGSAGTAATAAQRRTVLNFKLDVDDAGQLLERFGMSGVVRGGKGQLDGTLGWLGSPLALDHPSLTGQMQLDVERGQFLKAEPGLAKLLGVLSLQALPRRLLLDFKDVFSEGFAFDFVRGDARIHQGVATTNNLQMKGINAAVLLEGQADIARETQDIHAVVVPELNAGTASLLASAINPAVGLGSFLAQFLLRQPLQEAATQEFRITGRWDDPQVERLQRKPPASLPLPSQ